MNGQGVRELVERTRARGEEIVGVWVNGGGLKESRPRGGEKIGRDEAAVIEHARERERGERELAREEEERTAVPAEKGRGEETRKRQNAAFPTRPAKLNCGRNRGLVERQNF